MKKFSLLCALVWLAAYSGLWCVTLAQKELPEAVAYEGTLSFEDAEKTAAWCEENGRLLLSAYSEASALAGTAGSAAEETVRVVCTDERYGEAAGISLSSGRWLAGSKEESRGKTGTQKEAGEAVLDKALADHLFPGADTVGQPVRIGNAWYTVCGVTAPRGWLSRWLAPEVPSAYVMHGEEMEAASLLWTDTGNPFPEQLTGFVADAAGSSFSPELRVDYGAFRRMTEMFRRMAAWAAGACAAVCAAYLGIRRLARRSWSSRVSGAALLLLAAALLFLIRFAVTLPPDWIPADNVFDFAWYRELWRQVVSWKNASAGFAPALLAGAVTAGWRLLLIAAGAATAWCVSALISIHKS